jgi:2-polyprenyl-6-methoxyphenol hydroxylase-like FAD-dependent oxidoreductase
MNSTPPPSSSSSVSWSSWSPPSSALSREPYLRVAVIGAGLGGLTLGQLLQDAGNVQVTVYERSVGSDRLSGYRIMLSHFVLKKLQASLRAEIWARITISLGISPKDGHELSFMKR